MLGFDDRQNFFLEVCVSENVGFMFGDLDEGEGIGTSDIGACVRNVCRDMKIDFDTLDSHDFMFIRRMISDELSLLEMNR